MKKLLLAAALFCASVVHAAGVNVLMHHNDTNHTGANLAETQLTPSNVNSAQFGKLWDYEVDSEVYAQPLIIQNVTIPGLGTHDVVIVATMNNTVYAFDADNNLGANVVPLWQTNFNDPAAGIVPPRTANLFGGVTNIDPLTPDGIVSTPAIDLTTNTIYVVSRTVQNGTYGYQLHALDLTTGADRTNSPVTITASVPGTGYDAVNGVVTFNPQQQLQRDALGLVNNQVVIAWGSQGDIDPYHGWVMTYNKSTLQQTGVFNTTPTGSEGGVWQSGDGPSIDANGYMYYAVGNGTFDGVANFGESVIKFNVANGIAVQSFFTPANYLTLDQGDLDLGVSGPLLIPGTSLLLNGSKTGDLYLLNTGSLGGEVPGNTQIPQTFTAAAGHIHGSPVYFPYSASGALIYIWSENDYLKAFQFNGSTLGTSPITTSSFAAPPGMPGGVMSISSNGSQAGTGVVWASIPLNADAESAVVSGVLRVFDASNLSSELYDTQQNATRDSIGLYSKYTPPTVANGKVYMATFSNKLRVYGLLASQSPGPKGSLKGTSSTATGTVNLTAAGTSDWAHWPGYLHKATGGSQITDLESLYPPYTTQTYTNDPRTFTWTDGTPTATGSVTTGVYVSGWAGGYQISAPADTNPRTLTVYVGGFNSSGHLRAYLSDGSAEDFIATTSTSSGAYYIAYTLTYTAGQSGQLLYVQWTQASSSGNVTIAGATLTGGSAPTTPPVTPTGITATQGTSATGVTLNWSAASGATGYTLYRSTVAGTQGTVLTSTTGTSFTDASAAPGTTYYYSIAATNSNGSSSVSAQVSGYVPAANTGGGALSGVGLGTLTTANLTTVGTSDWAHWPEFTEKATGGAQISNYSLVGTATVNTYNNAPLTLTWSDGKPTATGSATTGSFVAGIGNGFQITVPADTTARQITVYVGGWQSVGKLTAHLSDGSAADFTDSSYSSATTIYQANYTLTYHAASAGQILTITWTMASGAGNVVLDGAALAGGTAATPPAAPTGVSATQGTSTTGVTVSWTTVSGATGYTVYRSTASGTQGAALGTTTTTSYPDTSAVAGATYYYSVAATNTAGASAVSAQVSGYVAAASSAGALSGVGLGTLTTANLTTVGTTDWAHWPEFTEKVTGGAQISNYSLVGTGTASTYGNATLTLTWTDGNRTATGSATTGSFVAGIGNGFQITVPADTTARQITVYVGGWQSVGKLTAHLSDGSAADFTDSSYSSATTIYQANYTLTYHAASAAQTLTITWTMASGAGNVVLDGASLH